MASPSPVLSTANSARISVANPAFDSYRQSLLLLMDDGTENVG